MHALRFMARTFFARNHSSTHICSVSIAVVQAATVARHSAAAKTFHMSPSTRARLLKYHYLQENEKPSRGRNSLKGEAARVERRPVVWHVQVKRAPATMRVNTAPAAPRRRLRGKTVSHKTFYCR